MGRTCPTAVGWRERRGLPLAAAKSTSRSSNSPRARRVVWVQAQLEDRSMRNGFVADVTRLSRREALRTIVGAGALLTAGLWPGALRADGVDAGRLRFVVINDLHYFDENC